MRRTVILLGVLALLVLFTQASPAGDSNESKKKSPKLYVLRRKTPSSSEEQTPITVSGSSNNHFRSNIPLPQNPFIPMTPPLEEEPETIVYPPVFAQEPATEEDAGSFASRADSGWLPLGATAATWLTSFFKRPASSDSAHSESIHTPSYKIIPTPPRPLTRPTPIPSNKAQISEVLERLEEVEKMREALPPPPAGSHTPFGERTTLLLKFPQMPEREKSPLKPITVGREDWSSPSDTPLRMKDSDMGVIVSQNFLLLPGRAGSSSSYSSREDESELLSELARALAERNREVNSHRPIGTKKEPPFVLIHLESYAKRENRSTPFGFSEEIERSFGNGTVIYPTLDDPSVMASTSFEFSTAQDLEDLFDRPLMGESAGGEMRPIVPLGLADIHNFLHLIHLVHKEGHSGAWERGVAFGKVEAEWKQNWVRTSTMGVRTLSDTPSAPPIRLPIPYPI